MELLRTIKKARWNLSVEITSDDTKILNLLPDPIGNLNTIESRLSVWDIGIDRGRLGQIIKSLAKRGDKFQNIAYAIFSSALLEKHHISMKKTLSSEHKKISNYHYDIEIPTSKNLLELTKSIILNAELDRMYSKEIENLP